MQRSPSRSVWLGPRSKPAQPGPGTGDAVSSGDGQAFRALLCHLSRLLASRILVFRVAPLAFSAALSAGGLEGARPASCQGAALHVGFLCFLGLAAFHLDASATVYLRRYSIWVAGALLVFLYAFNLDEAGRNKVIAGLAVLWIGVVAGGLLGAVDPHGSISTIGGSLIPKSYASNSIVYSSIHPVFAQSSSFLGVGIPRPSSPFPYTNTWGAVFGLLLPCVWLRYQSASQRYKRLLVMVAVISLVSCCPGSLDRGLWLSLAAAALFVLLRPTGGTSRMVAFRVVLPAAAVGLVLVLVTPLGGLIVDRFHHGQSNRHPSITGFGSTLRCRAPVPHWLATGRPQGSHVLRASGGRAQPAIGTQGNLAVRDGHFRRISWPDLLYVFFLLAAAALLAATRLPREPCR